MTELGDSIPRLDKFAEGGIVEPHELDDDWLDDFTQELLEAMTQPIGDIPQGAYTCCFYVKQEIDNNDTTQ